MIRTKQSKRILPAIAAASGSLMALPASALELGEPTVHSHLGQPLRASIAIALSPNEQVFNSCVSLSRSRSDSGMPPLRQATVSVANGVISLTGSTPVNEPLISARLIVDCPNTAHLSREYMLFVDPPGTQAQNTVAAAPIAVQQPAVTTRPAARPAAARPTVRRTTTPARAATAIDGTRYQVRRGDSLSVIAQRIENRPVSIWQAVQEIFEANPQAFIDNDPNQLKAGSFLTIPDFGAAPPSQIAESISDTAPVAAPETTAETVAVEEAVPATVETAVTETAVTEAAETEVVIPDTELEAPRIEAANPNVPSAVITRPVPAETEARNWSWLLWLGGAGAALIVALLLFGRRRQTYDTVAAEALHPQRRAADSGTENLTAISELASDLDDADTDLSDDSPTTENVALDAELIIGSDTSTGVDVDLSEDFSYTATAAELDLELPEEMSSNPETTSTNLIPPMFLEDPMSEQDEFDAEQDMGEEDDGMAVAVDIASLPTDDEQSMRDLMALDVEQYSSEDIDADSADTLIQDGYTMEEEADFRMLEQDYEDEFTATQALNQEIAKAAAELAKDLDENGELGYTDETAVMDNDIAITVSIEANEETVEMPAAENDVTVEMDVESGRFSSKAG